jgi:hypothetical protein
MKDLVYTLIGLLIILLAYAYGKHDGVEKGKVEVAESQNVQDISSDIFIEVDTTAPKVDTSAYVEDFNDVLIKNFEVSYDENYVEIYKITISNKSNKTVKAIEIDYKSEFASPDTRLRELNSSERFKATIRPNQEYTIVTNSSKLNKRLHKEYYLASVVFSNGERQYYR